jgi:hypothetical protein
MTTVLPAASAAAESGEETLTAPEASAYQALLDRLNRQSVDRHYEAYTDVDWDGPEMQIDPADPRWELNPDLDPLAATGWYQGLSQEQRARLGLEMVASKMKLGLQFESILKRGLLEYAATLPNFSSEFRYAYHEVIEEAHHSLMFQEFVNRSGFDARGLGRADLAAVRVIIGLGRRFPELFFFFVLGGEDPIDHVQRRALRSAEEIHPLLERIMRIHVTEEARHLSFARHYLKQRVPRLNPLRRLVLSVGTPLTLGGMAQMVLLPSRQIRRRHEIPPAVIREAYLDNPAHRTETIASLRKVRTLAEELSLLGPLPRRLWKALGLWGVPKQ